MRAYGVQLNCQVSWCTCCSIEVVIMIMRAKMENMRKAMEKEEIQKERKLVKEEEVVQGQ